jgi:hypothetical protein
MGEIGNKLVFIIGPRVDHDCLAVRRRDFCRLAGLLPASLAGARPGPDDAYTQLRAGPVRRSVAVRNFRLARGGTTIEFTRGRFSFLPLMAGAVFEGAGRLEGPFSEAVLLFSDGTAEEILAAGEPLDESPRARQQVLDRWRNRRPSGWEPPPHGVARPNAEAELLADLRNLPRQGSFRAWFGTGGGFPLRFIHSPAGALPELGVADPTALIGENVRHFGPGRTADPRLVAARAYRIELELARTFALTARAEIELECLRDGIAVVPLLLDARCRVEGVQLDAQSARFVQEPDERDGRLYLLLSEPWRAGQRARVTVDYRGDGLDIEHDDIYLRMRLARLSSPMPQSARKYSKDDQGFDHRELDAGKGDGFEGVLGRRGWYPMPNAAGDRATFELRIATPAHLTAVASGQLRSQTTNGTRNASEWVSALPIEYAGLALGPFRAHPHVDEATGVQVELQIYRLGPTHDPLLANALPGVDVSRGLAELQNPLRLFSHWFGPPPGKRLTAVQCPLPTGEAAPQMGFVSVWALDKRRTLTAAQTGSEAATVLFSEELARIAACQWWGQQTTPATHADNWLTCGLASFATALCTQQAGAGRAAFLLRWGLLRDSLTQPNRNACVLNDLAPLSRAALLANSPRGNPATLVHAKGAFIIHMLRCLFFEPRQQDERFRLRLREFTALARGRAVRWPEFQAVLEKELPPELDLAGDGRLDWFFREWLDETALPDYGLDYKVQPEGAIFHLSGRVRQAGVGAEFRMRVPIYAEYPDHLSVVGWAALHGNQERAFQLRLPRQPRSLRLNASHDILYRRANASR